MPKFRYHDENGKSHVVEADTGSAEPMKEGGLMVKIDKKIIKGAQMFTVLPPPIIIKQKPKDDDDDE